MEISDKKKAEIYQQVHDAIMDARLKIWAKRHDKNVSIAEIDEILSDLCWTAPKRAVECFK